MCQKNRVLLDATPALWSIMKHMSMTVQRGIDGAQSRLEAKSDLHALKVSQKFSLARCYSSNVGNHKAAFKQASFIHVQKGRGCRLDQVAHKSTCNRSWNGVQDVLLKEGCAKIGSGVVMGIGAEGGCARRAACREPIQHIDGAAGCKWAVRTRNLAHLIMTEEFRFL